MLTGMDTRGLRVGTFSSSQLAFQPGGAGVPTFSTSEAPSSLPRMGGSGVHNCCGESKSCGVQVSSDLAGGGGVGITCASPPVQDMKESL